MSINTVAVNIIMQTGISNTIRTARDLGMKANLPEVPSIALGVASIPLQEMVSVYATIANLGKIVTPYALLQIENSKGDLIEAFEVPQPDRCKVDPENCRILINMMQAAVNEGTGHDIRSKFKVPGDFAGKTGTTQEYADGSFIGFSPDLTAGCWVGADDQSIHFRTMTYGQGAYMALPVVGRFFSQLYANPRFSAWSSNHFEAPDSLTQEKMNELPGNIENLESEREFNFFDIFRKKDARLESGEKKENLRKHVPGENPQKENEPAWEKIKKIFKKDK
jgi:penicillin-binding protein 1A